MANLNFPASPLNNDTYVINGTTYVYNSTKGYWAIQTATSLEDLELTGNLTVAGTVDGRDVSVDGTKLDGIEAGATADQTKADIDALGIDAATLGGNAASYFTGYTDTAISNLIDTAPTTLDTLNELAAALGDDPNFATTVTNSIAGKVAKSGDTMTGNLTVPNLIVTGNVDGRDVSVDGTKLDGIEAGADVTDTANVTAAGALMDSEVTNLAAVKAFDPSDYATAAQGTLAASAVQPGDNISTLTNDSGFTTNTGTVTSVAATVPTGFTITGTPVTSSGTLAIAYATGYQGYTTTEATKLSGIETGADVTDAGNVNPLVDAHLNTSTATASQVLSWTGTDYDWVAQSTGGTPAGSDTEIQFNNNGSFGASSSLTWNGTILSVPGIFTSSSPTFGGEAFFLDDVSFLTGSTTKNVFNTYATTINAFGAATTLNIGASTGTTTIGNDLTVTGGDIVLGGTGRIQGIDTVTDSTDAASKGYVDAAVASGGGGITTGKAIAMTMVFG